MCLVNEKNNNAGYAKWANGLAFSDLHRNLQFSNQTVNLTSL